ncbi:LytTR family DNA-binding domain-containing protein [soil metagenome]
MIRAILIDDEVHCLYTLSMMLKENCPEIIILDKCTSAVEAILSIEKHKPSLVFLDIEMKPMNGFQMLEQFDEIPFAVIFTTSYDQYALKAIHFSALEYLLKPIDRMELIVAVQKVHFRKTLPAFEQFNILLDLVNNKPSAFNKIAVPTLEGFELFPADQLLRCDASNNYTFLYLKGNVKIVASRSIKEMEEQLKVFSFYLRVHYSHIVNLNEVTKYIRGEGGYLVMSDGSSVNVSRSRKESLMKYF